VSKNCLEKWLATHKRLDRASIGAIGFFATQTKRMKKIYYLVETLFSNNLNFLITFDHTREDISCLNMIFL